MPVTIPSFAKINLGLRIGPLRPDRFHELRTVYQTIALHDVVTVQAGKGVGLEIRSKDARVPDDERNTCWRIAERVLRALKTRAKIIITIDKRLPVQGGLGAASSNAVATLLGLERELKKPLEPAERMRIAEEVGSDVPLFLVGGTVLGVGRGQQVYALEDLPALPLVVVTPPVAVSTPQAFADWDSRFGGARLTDPEASDTINQFSRSVYEWLSGTPSGVPARGGNRAEALLLDLVRTGIENDFERVVFPKYPELRDMKRALEREGASYSALSGSGSALFGLFPTKQAAEQAARRLQARGVSAAPTSTLTRQQYWAKIAG